jgi:hypothetical protein
MNGHLLTQISTTVAGLVLVAYSAAFFINAALTYA